METKEIQNIDATGNEAPMSFRDKFHGKIKSKYPDVGDDEEGIYSKAYEDYEGLEKYQETNRATNKQIAEVLTSYPEVAKMIKGLSDGMSLREALARYMDLEGIEAMEGDPDYEGLSTAKAERMKAMEEEENYAKEFDSNVEMSQKEIKDFAESTGKSEEQIKTFLDDVDELISNIHKGLITRKMLDKLDKAMNYDSDVADAAEAAAINAKNQKIELAKAGKNDAVDGLPNLSSSPEYIPMEEDKSPAGSLAKTLERQQKRQIVK